MMRLAYAATVDAPILRAELPASIRATLVRIVDALPSGYPFAGCVLEFDTPLTGEQIDTVAALVALHAARLSAGYYVAFAKYQADSRKALTAYQKRLIDRMTAFRAQWNAIR